MRWQDEALAVVHPGGEALDDPSLDPVLSEWLVQPEASKKHSDSPVGSGVLPEKRVSNQRERRISAHQKAPLQPQAVRPALLPPGASPGKEVEAPDDFSKAKRFRKLLRLLNSPKMRNAVSSLKRRTRYNYGVCSITYVSGIAATYVLINQHVSNMLLVKVSALAGIQVLCRAAALGSLSGRTQRASKASTCWKMRPSILHRSSKLQCRPS